MGVIFWRIEVSWMRVIGGSVERNRVRGNGRCRWRLMMWRKYGRKVRMR